MIKGRGGAIEEGRRRVEGLRRWGVRRIEGEGGREADRCCGGGVGRGRGVRKRGRGRGIIGRGREGRR